jgi:hypothetical protein
LENRDGQNRCKQPHITIGIDERTIVFGRSQNRAPIGGFECGDPEQHQTDATGNGIFHDNDEVDEYVRSNIGKQLFKNDMTSTHLHHFTYLNEIPLFDRNNLRTD